LGRPTQATDRFHRTWRDLLASNRQLAEKFAELERKVGSHDQIIVGILKAIREFMHAPVPKKRPIGFTANLDESD
jgi:hypothetical protein